MAQSVFPVLVVDDEVQLLETMEYQLSKQGFSVLSASSQEQAKELLKSKGNEIAIVISDYKLREGTGFDLREWMLAQGMKSIPLVIISGFIDRDQALSAIELAISAFIPKPFAPEELHSIVDRESKDRIDLLTEQREIEECFFIEATDLLEELEPLLLKLEDDPTDVDTVNIIFRLVHTIKGGAGVLSNRDLAELLHSFEDLLSAIKQGRVTADESIMGLLLSAFDSATSVLKAIQNNVAHGIDINAVQKSLESARNTEVDRPRDTGQPVDNSGGDEQHAAKTKEDGIHVPTTMLDNFMVMSGEITVIRNMVNKLVRTIERKLPGDEDVGLLDELLEEMHKINGSMQTQISELRKLPINGICKRIPRLVRDLSKKLGKEIKLTIKGQTLRVDTKLTQVLQGALTHLIRNSIDHGIETPQERDTCAKPPIGNLELVFREDGENVFVSISDDGRGIDPHTIRKKAIEKGLIDEHSATELNDRTVLQYIFEPGFSTASEVTDVSGRGVGLDMVRTSILGLRGRLEVDSDVGSGATFSIVLPIPKSVVITHSLIVRCHDREFAIPQDSIQRLLRIAPERHEDFIQKLEGTEVLLLDNDLIPLVNLSMSLNSGCDHQRVVEEMNIVLIQVETQRYGLVVDQILDAEDMVVKPLHDCVEEIGKYSGATFMGDGNVGLILDPEGMAPDRPKGAENAEERQTRDSEIPRNGDDLLLFRLNTKGMFAVTLNDVFRLEQFLADDLRPSGNLKVIEYRGGLMPVFPLSDLLGFTSGSQPSTNVSVIVINLEDRLVGLAIESIHDLIRFSGKRDQGIRDRQGIEAALVHDDQVITQIDVLFLAEQAMEISQFSKTETNNKGDCDATSPLGSTA